MRKQRRPDSKIPDFRSTRTKLPSSAFAISPGRDRKPSDIVEREIWDSITSLPDDVSLRTSDHFGSCLRIVWDFWGEWICVVGALQAATLKRAESPLAIAATAITDDFQVSVYNAVTGFYRGAIGSLRSVLEQITVGSYLELSQEQAHFEQWQSASQGFGFGRAADLLRKHAAVSSVEQTLLRLVGDDLFRPKNGPTPGGLIRRTFDHLNHYVHSQPRFTDGDIWKSNGPIFRPEKFVQWAHLFVLVLACTVLLARIGQPKLYELPWGSKYSAQSLFSEAVRVLGSKVDGKRLLKAVPKALWL